MKLTNNTTIFTSIFAWSISLLLLSTYFLLGWGDKSITYIAIFLLFLSVWNAIFKLKGQSPLGLLLIFPIIPHFVFMLRQGGLPLFITDQNYFVQLESMIVENHKWSLGMGLFRAQEYSYYPLTALWGSLFQIISGLPVVTMVAIFSVLNGVLPPLFYFMLIKDFLKEDAKLLIYTSTFIFMLNYQFLFHDSLFAYESMAIIFSLMVIYLFNKGRGFRNTSALLFLLVISLVLTHHFTVISTILILSSFYLLSYFQHGDKPQVSIILLLALTFLFYSMFVVVSEFGFYLDAILKFFSTIGEGSGYQRISPLDIYRLEPYETAIIIVGQMMLAFFGFVGFIKPSKSKSHSFFKGLFLIGALYFIFSIVSNFVSPKLYTDLPFRTMVPSFLLMAPTISRGILGKYQEKRFLLLFTTLLSIFLMLNPFYRLVDMPIPTQTTLQTSYWIKSYIPMGTEVLPSQIGFVADAISSYGRVLNFFTSSNILTLPTFYNYLFNGNLHEFMKNFSLNYFILYNNYNEWNVKWWIMPYMNSSISYNFMMEYISAANDKLNRNVHMLRIYDSGEISIYFLLR
jgi:hypothetical protein